jgi:hypothetical protein
MTRKMKMIFSLMNLKKKRMGANKEDEDDIFEDDGKL